MDQGLFWMPTQPLYPSKNWSRGAKVQVSKEHLMTFITIFLFLLCTFEVFIPFLQISVFAMLTKSVYAAHLPHGQKVPLALGYQTPPKGQKSSLTPAIFQKQANNIAYQQVILILFKTSIVSRFLLPILLRHFKFHLSTYNLKWLYC